LIIFRKRNLFFTQFRRIAFIIMACFPTFWGGGRTQKNINNEERDGGDGDVDCSGTILALGASGMPDSRFTFLSTFFTGFFARCYYESGLKRAADRKLSFVWLGNCTFELP